MNLHSLTPTASRSALRFPLRAAFLSALLCGGLGLPAAAGSNVSDAPPAAPAAEGRVIFLGFDGADARTAKEMMEAGGLPNLRRLSEQGAFAPLATTNPAESPVAWASLNSGRNPAETGIVGFVRRDLKDGIPIPIKGFSVDGVPVQIEEFDLPVSLKVGTWSPVVTGLVFGLVPLIAFLIVFGALLRLKAAPTVVLSAVLAGVGLWAGLSFGAELPPTMPVVQNPVAAPPFWELAAAAGVESVVLDGAQAWDRPPVGDARVLCGLGVPDARGDYISYFVYTTDDLYFVRDPSDSKAGTGSGGLKLRVDEREGVIESELPGPKNFVELARLEGLISQLKAEKQGLSDYKRSAALTERIKLLEEELDGVRSRPLGAPLRVVKKGDGTADVTLGSQTQNLAEGTWSDWYHLGFELSRLIKIHAITRVRLSSLDEPYFELYVNALEIDPARPPFWQPISQPAGFSRELVEINGGPFETLGWSCMTHPFKDEIVDVVAFMEDIEFTMKWRENLTYSMLARDDWRLLVSLFSTPDRVQHMMYQYYDEGHPLYDADEAARTMTFFGEVIELRDAIPACYRQIDRIVGHVMDEYLRPEDTLLVGADHGFQSFRRQVHINNWLVEHGYMKLKNITSSLMSKMVHSYVDWSATQAYSMGLGTVYLNLEGREPDGIVKPSEADALMRAIRDDFLAYEDPDLPGTKVGGEVYFAKDVHSGPFLDLDAEMFFCYAPTYRSSWATATGSVSMKKQDDGTYKLGPTVVDNDKMWSGDHVSVDPEFVKGIFFSSRKLAVPEGGADLLQIAPTILSLLDLPIPPEMDMPALALQ